MPFQFQHTELSWLFLLAGILLLLFLAVLRWKKVTIQKIGDKRLINVLISNFSSRLFAVKFVFFSAAFALGILAVMNPGNPGAEENINRKGIDVAIALDVSKSMLATDIAPNRLERAKQFVNKLMDEMPNDRIALVLFAGKAYLQMPLTVDHGAARLFISSSSPATVPQQGTVISDALTMSANAFSNTDRRYKAVILISDGEDHDEEAVKKAKELAERGVMINTIGIGSPAGSTLTDPLTGVIKRDETGATVISKLNETELKELAAVTNGVYVHLQGSADAVNQVKEQLSQIERKTFGDVSQMNFRTYYTWFAAMMLLLLLVENFIPERKSFKKAKKEVKSS